MERITKDNTSNCDRTDRPGSESSGVCVVLQAATALVVSALLVFLFGAFISDSGTDRQDTFTIRHDMLSVNRGGFRSTEDALEIFPRDKMEFAIASRNLRLNAAEYSYLEYYLDGITPDSDTYLVWTQDSGRQYHLALQSSTGKPANITLEDIPDWTGTIVNVGVYSATATEHAPLRIHYLALMPADWHSWLLTARQDLAPPQTWKHSSINNLEAATFPATGVVLAIWLGLAALLLLLFGLTGSRQTRQTIIVTSVVGWIFFDSLWQLRLLSIQKQTRATLDGKSMHERYLASNDSDLYQYADRLKRNLLPLSPARIFILKDSRGHDFERLKLQYFLLPHRIYNFGSTLPSESVTAGDYVLFLGGVPAQAETIKGFELGGEVEFRLDLLEHSGNRRLYRVRQST